VCVCVCVQGCASWKWYFPFHYAPFASDFKDVVGMFDDFEKDTKPVRCGPPQRSSALSCCPML